MQKNNIYIPDLHIGAANEVVEEQTVPGEEQRGRENKRRTLAQHNRMSGKAYEGLRKNKQSKKWEYVAREGRKLADRKDLCGKSCTDTSTIAACPKITDDERKELFDSY